MEGLRCNRKVATQALFYWPMEDMPAETAPQETDKSLETVDLSGIEIFSEGSWNGDAYSGDDLQAMVDAFPQVGFKPTVKAGHAGGQDDEKKARQVFGAPALGYGGRIYRSGKKLLADLIGVPKRFADLVKAGAYKRISAEIYMDYKDEANGKKWPRVLKSIAFLGADIPALTTLKEVEALYQKNANGTLFAYDDKGNEFRAYYMDCAMPASPGMGLADFLVNFPRKSKEIANYRLAEDEDKSCNSCKFFIGYPQTCVLVEGRIEHAYVSDYFEGRAEMKTMGGNGEVKKYTIEERDGEFCLISSAGKILGCHDSKSKAEAQERAVQANKHELRVSAKQMETICAPCAESMRQKNFSAIKLTPMLSSDGVLTYAFPGGAPEGLCDKFSPDEGFRTRCMDSSAAAKADDAGAFCNALKVACKDKGLLSSNQLSKEYAMEIMEKDGQHCVMDGETTVKCYPTRAEAEEHMKTAKMQKGGPDMDEKKFEELRAQSKADLEAKEAEIKKDYGAKLADAKRREDEQAAKIKTLERQRYDDQNEAWIKEQKSPEKGRLVPVEEPRIRAIFSALFEDARVVKFSHDGKEETETLMQAVKAFVEKRPNVYKEVGVPGDDLPAETDSPGEEVNRRTVEYMNKNNTKDYGAAMNAVLKADTKLAADYLRMQKQ